jgi:hypothetical protein
VSEALSRAADSLREQQGIANDRPYGDRSSPQFRP